MYKKFLSVLFLISLLSLLISVSSLAAVPQKMNFQGRLMKITGGGTPTPETGGKTVIFRIYDAPTGSFNLNWEDLTHQVSCDSQGQFSTVLDFSTGQSLSFPLDFSKLLYLQVNYDGKDLTPRQPLETVPYAFTADTLGSAEIAVGPNIGIGTTSPSSKLTVAGTIESTQGGLKFPDGTIQTTAVTTSSAGGWTSSAGKVVLTNISDKVGIGTASPGASLTVAVGRIQAAGVTNPTTGEGLELGYDGTSGFIVPYSRITDTYKALQYNALDHEFLISGVQKVTIDTAGNVGIGTSYPAGALHVSSEASPNALVVKSGKVGIGTATPGASLEVKGTVKMLGVFTSYLVNVTYEAPTDGFVVAIFTANSSGSGRLFGYTGSNPSSFSLFCAASVSYGDNVISNTFTMPVKKGDYWYISEYGAMYTNEYIKWIPLGQ
jgi:hypothetical protein